MIKYFILNRNKKVTFKIIPEKSVTEAKSQENDSEQ